MRCRNCGAILQNGVRFCRECGTKVVITADYCQQCGAKLYPNANYCVNCGTKVSQQMTETTNKIQSDQAYSNQQHQVKAKKSIGRFLLAILPLLIIAFLLFGPKVKPNKQTNESPVISYTSVPVIQEAKHSIQKGTKYAYMSDEWDVYIANAISDSIISIEHWGKTNSSVFKVDYIEDIGAYKINEPSVQFGWLDNEHTAFSLMFSDKNNSRISTDNIHVFTICIDDNNYNKGTLCDQRISRYVYTSDEWHIYRAIPLSDTLVKIECWYRNRSTDKEYGYGWSWCVINQIDKGMGFEWTDEERTSFTITSHDSQNVSHWKQDSFVVFKLEDSNYSFASVYDYLKKHSSTNTK